MNNRFCYLVISFFILSNFVFSQELIWEKTYKFDDSVKTSISTSSIKLKNGNFAVSSTSYVMRDYLYYYTIISNFNSEGEYNWHHTFKPPHSTMTSKLIESDNGKLLLSYITPKVEVMGGYYGLLSLGVNQYSLDGSLVGEYIDTSKYSKEDIGIIYFNSSLFFHFFCNKESGVNKLKTNQYEINGKYLKTNICDTPNKNIIDLKINNSYQNSEGKYYLCGYYLYYDSTKNTNNYGGYLQKFDSDLNKNWIFRFDSSDYHIYYTKIIENKNKELIVFCRTLKIPDVPNYIAHKFTSEGVLTASYRLSSLNDYIYSDYYLTKNNEYIIIGKKGNSDSSSFLIEKYDMDFNLISQKIYGNGSLNNNLYKIIEDTDSTFVVCGSSGDSLYLAKIKFTNTDVKDDNLILNSDLIITPNPVKDILKIKSDESYFLNSNKIEIYSILGVKYFETAFKQSIDVSGLPAGMYFIKIGNKVQKFVKM